MISNYILIIALALITTGISNYSIAADGADIVLTKEQKAAIERLSEDQAQKELIEITPNDIIEFNEAKKILDQTKKLFLKPPKINPPKLLRIDPRAKRSNKIVGSRVINVYQNQITTITIVDSQGEPWPLKTKPSVGSSVYTIGYAEDIPGYLTIQTGDRYVPANVPILLYDMVQPIHLQLRNDGNSLDTEVNIVVNAISRLNTTSMPVNKYEVPTLDQSGVRAFLREPPANAKLIPTIGDAHTEVWLWNDIYVVKTPHAVLNPQMPIDVQRNADESLVIYCYKEVFGGISVQNVHTGKIVNIMMANGY
jgi:hypothetical protein